MYCIAVHNLISISDSVVKDVNSYVMSSLLVYRNLTKNNIRQLISPAMPDSDFRRDPNL